MRHFSYIIPKNTLFRIKKKKTKSYNIKSAGLDFLEETPEKAKRKTKFLCNFKWTMLQFTKVENFARSRKQKEKIVWRWGVQSRDDVAADK